MIDVSSIAHGSEPKVAPQSLFEFPYRIRRLNMTSSSITFLKKKCFSVLQKRVPKISKEKWCSSVHLGFQTGPAQDAQSVAVLTVYVLSNFA